MAIRATLAFLILLAPVASADITFTNAVHYPAGFQPTAITAADIDRDGDVDLVSTDQIGGDVWVHYNNGSGVFSRQSVVDAGSAPRIAAVADLNGDGWPDLAIPNWNERYNTVSVFFNDTQGGFHDRTAYGVGSKPRTVAIGDMDNDNMPDLIVANNVSATVSILFNQGDGRFGSHISYRTAAGIGSASVADLDGDGDLDVYFSSRNEDILGVFMNIGDGILGEWVRYDVGTTPKHELAADFDGDGMLDIVCPDGNSNTVSFLRARGDGTFAQSVQFATGASPHAIASADFDLDGAVDLVVATSEINRLTIHRNQGGGSFDTPIGFLVGREPLFVCAADFNGDQLPDLASANMLDGTISILLNTTIPVKCRVDLNHDGRVNTVDFILFLNLFWADDPAADFDANGIVNTLDFIEFLIQYSRGCD